MTKIEINTSDRESRNFRSKTERFNEFKPINQIKFLNRKFYLLAALMLIFTSVLTAYINNSEVFTKTVSGWFSFSNKQENTFESYTFDFDSSINNGLKKAITETLEAVKFENTPRYCFVDNTECQDKSEELAQNFVISLSKNSEINSTPVEKYVLAGHLYWVKDDFDEKLVEGLETGANSLKFNELNVYVTKNDKTAILVAKEYGMTPIEIDESTVLSKLEDSEEIPALISINSLSFNHKLLWINGNYYLDEVKKSNVATGGSLPLFVDFVGKSLQEHITNSLPIHLNIATKSLNADPDLFTINMTGVTAITRRLTPLVANNKDGAYPARKIGEFLADANLTHVSNEISFVNGCTNANGMVFCSLPETLETLKFSGVDIVELTGNHNNDYGAIYNEQTINKYTESGIAHFGGGLNLEDARKPFLASLDKKRGQDVAILGYNYWNAHFNFTGALASADRAGANPYSKEQVKKDIESLKEQGKFIIVTFQFTECYSYPDGYVIYPTCYRSDTVANQETVFKEAIDFGADMVVGTQAHQPQTFEIYNSKPIFYGLGNLFFDQTMWPGTKHGLVLTHYFNAGKYIQTKITTTNYEKDLQTYVTTGNERESLLKLLKTAR